VRQEKDNMVEIINNMADEPASKLGPVVKFERTTQKIIKKVLELTSSS
jgi:hypothetical protein